MEVCGYMFKCEFVSVCSSAIKALVFAIYSQEGVTWKIKEVKYLILETALETVQIPFHSLAEV